ncbi:hypothetical protein [Rhodococcus sp. 4CII]|uniref:hypothetical protein n=1 Tax=Rhodococcus sp. 4CII TaxID=2834580 RepID=UPI0002A38252|nr:hypothetical protein [Rhodococcus sp. 4CII]ELB87719.1 hypothetical protein Rwratislav_38396 [Rhodococcus wratislaviensis IFP 2016]MBC2637539.1 hypothetical protein [Rhodococcus sp. 3A]MBC2898107.1 hypothetical protein [Rhodococcus sp. 4CII]
MTTALGCTAIATSRTPRPEAPSGPVVLHAQAGGSAAATASILKTDGSGRAYGYAGDGNTRTAVPAYLRSVFESTQRAIRGVAGGTQMPGPGVVHFGGIVLPRRGVVVEVAEHQGCPDEDAEEQDRDE